MATAGGGGWADIHPDLLANILSGLDVIDFIRALAVCVPWRYVPSPSNTSSLRFYPLIALRGGQIRTKKHEIGRLPHIVDRRHIGSSQGFVITTDKEFTTVDATNQEKCIKRSQGFIYRKAIISPSLELAAAVVESLMNLHYDYCFLARRVVLGRAGDASWIDLCAWFSDMPFLLYWTDILFHRDRLYAINRVGMLVIFDVNDPSATPVVIKDCCPAVDHGFLMESPDKKDLFLLTRYPEFEMFKLEESSHKFERIEDLGEVAVFFNGKEFSASCIQISGRTVSTRVHCELLVWRIGAPNT